MKAFKFYSFFIILFLPFILFSQAVKIYNSNLGQVESAIAINPTNSKNLNGTVNAGNGGTKHIDIFYSFDKGNNWTVHQNISGEGAADPVIYFDPDGVAYLIYQIRANKSIYLRKSTDGGVTWGNSITVVHFNESNLDLDKPWLAISPIRNQNGFFDVYISYTKIDNNFSSPKESYSVHLLRSSDGGQTFSDIYMESGYNVGSTVSASRFKNEYGQYEVVLAYTCLQDNETDEPFLRVKYGFNNSFSNNLSYGINLFGNKNNDIKGGIRVNTYPRLCADPYRGDFYLVWANGSQDGYSDLRMFKGERQNNGKLNWIYKGIIVNETGFQFDPAISVSQNGVVSLLYYSSADNSLSSPIYTYVKSCTDGSGNFGNRKTLGYANGFTVTSGNEFLGDYQGITSWYDENFSLFCQSKPISGCEDRQIYFQKTTTNDRMLPPDYIKVKVDQQDENGISFGKFKRWNQNQYTSYTPPLDFVFRVDSVQIIEAQQDYKSGTYEKYNNYEQQTDIKNHGKFIIHNDQNVIRAKFKNTSTAKLKAIFISGNCDTKATFKDPWLVLQEPYYNDTPYGYRNMGMDSAEFREFTNELNLTHDSPYEGVFLDQGYDPIQHVWTPPYYSVKAAAKDTFKAHGQDVTGHFLNWEGTDVDFQSPNSQETPVVFHQANAEARAVYKGHLASNISRASGYNNGRRICKTGDGKLHLVYEDDNTIWYTYSSDGGKTWAKEYAISPRPYSSNFIRHTFKNPSIASFGSTLYVVFEEIVQSNSATNHLIDFRKRWNNSWRPIENISDGSWQGSWWNGPWSERPSVAANEVNNIFVSWRDKTNHRIKARYYYNNQTWSYISTIYADGYPATTVLPSGENYPLKIVWSQSGKIKYISGEYNSSSNRCYWSSIQTLSDYAPSFYSNHVQPSVTSDLQGHGYVSWVADNEVVYEQYVLYQKFNFGYQATSASSTYELSRDEDYTTQNPSISYNQSNHYVTVFYQVHDNVIRKYLSGNTWHYHGYGSGKYPNICPDASTGTVWTTYTSAPYLLKTESLQNYLSKTTLAEVDAFKRFYFPANDSAYFTLDLKEFDADGQRLNFYYGLNSDTIRVEEPVTFNYQIDLGDHYRAGQWLSFYFVADGQKYLLDQVELNGNEKDNVINRSVTFDPGKATEGYVQIEFPQATPFVVNVVPDNATGLAKAASGGALQAFTPKSFRLNQNFPNPFNPTTQIVFDLPQESKVTLEVFDISGHKVATLAKGLKEAGRYRVVFDAHNLASGVYIYRLTTDKGFAQSKKMMLIR